MNLDPVWQKSPLSSFLGNDGIPETKANGGEAVQAEHLQSPVGEVRRQWTLFSPLESYAGCSKRPRTVGSDENLPKNISAIPTESQSVSPVSSLVKSNSNCAENQLYRYQTGPSEHCSTSKEEAKSGKIP